MACLSRRWASAAGRRAGNWSAARRSTGPAEKQASAQSNVKLQKGRWEMGVDGTHSRMNPSVLTCVSNRLYLGSAGAAAPATMQPMLEPAGGVATPGAHPTCVSPNDTPR